MGASDLKQYFNAVTYQKKEERKTSTNILAWKVEIKFTEFLVEHNLPVAAADHHSLLVKEYTRDSKLIQSKQKRFVF